MEIYVSLVLLVCLSTIAIIFFIIRVIFFPSKSTTDKLIDNIEDLGIITKAGVYYRWEDLDRVIYNNIKNPKTGAIKIFSLDLYFSNGKATANHSMGNMNELVAKCEQLEVVKAEKIVYYSQSV